MKIRFAVSAGAAPPDAGGLTDLVDSVEASGFDSLWFSDLTVSAATDPLLAVAFAAGRSRRVKLGVNLVPFGYEPYVFARQVAQLDRVTGGRLLVTLVPGLDVRGERGALGLDGVHRGQRMDALLPMLRQWWAGGAPDAGDGPAPVGLGTRPVQDPLEVWLGGSGPQAVERAGRLADGWLGALMDPTDAGRIRGAIADAAGRAGRSIDPEHFGMSILYAHDADELAANPPPLRQRGRRDVRALVPAGTTALRALVDALVHEGISKFVVRPLRAPQRWADELDWLAEAVLAKQT